MSEDHPDQKRTIGNVVLYDYRQNGKDLYSDGDDIENLILDIVRNRTGWDYCLQEYQSWPVLYHLSRQRENIVLPMDLKPGDRVLELGAGMGAITGALAGHAGKTDCVEVSMKRSTINAVRHREFSNITIYVGNFEDISLPQDGYDVVTMIGVLEYAGSFIHTNRPYADLVKKACTCLKPGGHLYIATENRLGMKYFAGYPEDHLAKAYAGIEGYGSGKRICTFTKSELNRMLEEAGLSNLYYYYPFPDYKLPTVIYSDDTIRTAWIDYNEKSNYDSAVVQTFSPLKALRALRGTQEIELFANSFLVRAEKAGS